jgi:hypothetical protein
MSRANIVQVHLGKEVPAHLYDQVRQLRLFNPDVPVFLILEAGTLVNNQLVDELEMTIVRKNSIKTCANHRRFLALKSLDPRYWKIFWRSASERFFLIESFLEACALKSVIHLENDVLLYAKVADLLPILSGNYDGIGLTMDCDWRCIPGFVYIKDELALSGMNEFVTSIPIRKRYNDMRALGAFMNEVGPPACNALPVIPEGYSALHGLGDSEGNKSTHGCFDRCFNDFGGIFDAAALGQYLGGLPRDGGKDTRGFINETAIVDPRRLGLHWELADGLKTPYGKIDGKSFPVFNLHIHSKNLRPFLSDSTRDCDE